MKSLSYKILVFFIVISSCAPRNPYYKSMVSMMPYHQYLAYLQKSQVYKIVDAKHPDYLLAAIPENLANANSTGECVLEIIIDEKQEIQAISIVGLLVENESLNTILGYDKFHASSKRAIEPPKQITNYISFLKEYILKQQIVQIKDSSKRNKIACLVYLNSHPSIAGNK